MTPQQHRRLIFGALFVTGPILVLVCLWAFGPRIRAEAMQAAMPVIPDLPEIETWLAQRENSISLRQAEVAKTIQWAHPDKKDATQLAFVYLHGFSATRFEISPVMENLGRAFEANIFFTRLSGHGQTGEQLAKASLQDWFYDAEEAWAIGQKLGYQVVLVGMSTGATLATWLASRHPEVSALILLSPNFGLRDARAGIAYWPWGHLILRLVIGREYSFKPQNSLQNQFWTTHYPVQAATPMFTLLKTVESLDLASIQMPLLALYSEHDEVVSPKGILDHLARFGSSTKDIVEVKEAHRHNLTGDILAPETTPLVTQTMGQFLRTLLPQ